MAAGLELRVPFLDVDLMRFVERIPVRARMRPRAGKRLHRLAMRRLLEPEIAGRPKHGFATPYDDWLRSSLGEEVERRYAPGSPAATLVRPQAVSRLVAEHRRGRADHKSVLYCLLELSEWHRAFVEGAPGPAPAEPAETRL
jgi:asparagine synthase (glutamine-hydrolysing)